MSRKGSRKNGAGLDTHRQAEARDDSAVTADTTAGHNSGERAKIMQECAEEMREIKAARSELNERASEVRERLENAGIHVKAFEAMLRITDMDDQAAQDSYLDGLREAAAALQPGENGELFPARAPAAASQIRTPTQKEARTAGREAGKAGKNQDTCPHPEGAAAFLEWQAGWIEGQAEIAAELAGASGNGAAAQAAVATT